MREVIARCKTCKEKFVYSRQAVQISLEGGESEPLRCDDCRRKHGREIRNFPNAFLPVKAKVRAGFLAAADAGTYRGEKEKEERQAQIDTRGMEFGITDEELNKLYRSLQACRVVVMVSGTGSGKSTLVPARLINPPEGEAKEFLEHLSRQGRIAITEPRIAAVQRVAHAIGRIAGSGVGPNFLVGFRHGSRKGDRGGGEQWNRYNQLVIVTDGSLRNWIQSGEIRKYSLIIVDEAHERNKNIDVIFGLLKRALQSHPHLKVIVASATINEEHFVRTFETTGVRVDLRNIPSKKQAKYFGPHFWQSREVVPECDCWLCRLAPQQRQAFWDVLPDRIYENTLTENVAELVLAIVNRTFDGSILVFLHGQYEIEQIEEILQSYLKSRIPVLALFGNLGEEEVEERIKKIEKQRGVLLATNLAETSLTIPNLRYVIDSGFIKENHWNPTVQVEKLRVRYHSKDGCRQRWGRVGRTEVGYVFTLYTESQFNDDSIFEPHTAPAITRERLDDVFVIAAAAGVDDVSSFPWVDAPDKERLDQTRKIVQEAGIVDEIGDITERGATLLRIPLSAPVASLANAACQLGNLPEALIFLLTAFTRDGTSRFGETLYDRVSGLFVWDSYWDVRVKTHVHLTHSALRMGCQDDVDFAIKLFHCFQEAHHKGVSEEWAERFVVNHRTLSAILEDFGDFCERFYAKDTHDDVRQFDLFRLPFIRQLLREHLPDATLHVVKETEERATKREQFIDQLIPVGTSVSIQVLDGEPHLQNPAQTQPPIRCEWVGKTRSERAYLLEWKTENNQPCARISALSEKEISQHLENRFKVKAPVTVKSIERDAYGPEGIALLETKDGLQFPVTLSALSLSLAGYGLERIVGQSITLDVIGAESDGRPILSNTCQIVDDLERLFEGKPTTMCDGLVEEINLDKRSAVMVVPRTATIIHGFELSGWRAISPHGRVDCLRLGEKVVLKLTKKNTQSYLHSELSLEEVASLPTGFSYNAEEKKLYFPNCFNPACLENCSLGGKTCEAALRISWRRGIEVEVKSLKERLLKLSTGQVVIGKVAQLISDRENAAILKSIQIVLSDGTPAFAFGDSVPPHLAQVGKEMKFVIEGVKPDDGYLRLVSLEAEINRLQEVLTRKTNQLTKANENLARNHIQKTEARTLEHKNRVQGWIDEQQQRIAKLKSDISDLKAKISSHRATIRKLDGS